MSWVLPGGALLVLVVLVTWSVFRLRGGSDAPPSDGRGRLGRLGRLGRRRGRSGAQQAPVLVARPRRPLEDIVSDARRFAPRVHEPPRGTSYAKHVAACSVYDRVLGEACDALEIEHLLGVLPPGEERDAERTRIETALWLAGLRLEDVA